MTITLDQALAVARQLAPRDRAQLVAQLVTELVEPAAPVAPTTATNGDAWERLEQLRREFAVLPRPAWTAAEQLERDRRERDDMLTGRPVNDVHA